MSQEGLSRIIDWSRLEGIFGGHLVSPFLLQAVLTFGQIAQGLVHKNFAYYQGWKFNDLSVSLFLYLTTLLIIFFPSYAIGVSHAVSFEDCLLFCCALLRRSCLSLLLLLCSL